MLVLILKKLISPQFLCPKLFVLQRRQERLRDPKEGTVLFHCSADRVVMDSFHPRYNRTLCTSTCETRPIVPVVYPPRPVVSQAQQ